MTTGEATQGFAQKLRDLDGEGLVTLHLVSGVAVPRVEVQHVWRTAVEVKATDDGPKSLIALDSIIGITWTEKDSA